MTNDHPAGFHKHEIFHQPDQIPFIQGLPLGKGAIGVVHEVQGKPDSQFRGQTYARKTIILENRQDQEAARHELAKEVDILKQVRHNHIVRLVTTYELNIEYAIVMDPRAKGNLDDHFLENTPEAREQLSQWFGCLSSGVAYLHENDIQHRDIKPHNILVNDANILLTDFGISRMTLGKTVPTTVLGGPRARTLEYCAPEVEQGHTRGRSADIFSLGAVFLEMFIVHSASCELKEFRQFLEVDGRQSYSKNTEKLCKWMDDLDQTPDSPPWHSTILFLCQQMLQERRDQRPTAGDLRAWWSHQPPSVLPPEAPGSCTCSRALPTEGYSEGETDENLRRAHANGHKLMVDFWRERAAKVTGNDGLAAASEGGLLVIAESPIKQRANASRERTERDRSPSSDQPTSSRRDLRQRTPEEQFAHERRKANRRLADNRELDEHERSETRRGRATNPNKGKEVIPDNISTSPYYRRVSRRYSGGDGQKERDDSPASTKFSIDVKNSKSIIAMPPREGSPRPSSLRSPRESITFKDDALGIRTTSSVPEISGAVSPTTTDEKGRRANEKMQSGFRRSLDGVRQKLSRGSTDITGDKRERERHKAIIAAEKLDMAESSAAESSSGGDNQARKRRMEERRRKDGQSYSRGSEGNKTAASKRDSGTVGRTGSGNARPDSRRARETRERERRIEERQPPRERRHRERHSHGHDATSSAGEDKDRKNGGFKAALKRLFEN
ncbi:hypothetical protein MKZ38_008352 [Zalerion maritima]|uniref:Protein kinase domain-containing protein n=1 Tax=Zalerion maritima TaxID=339359 RepID=A0AAD5WW58_9PEZI|nr:hypothetical protein MKZ38_008352 [Zalerion maritima]